VNNPTKIRIGMLLIAALFWVLDCIIDYFVFGVNTFLTFYPHKFIERFGLVVILVFAGEIVVNLESKYSASRDKNERLIIEKNHIFKTGLFGNSKEIRNRVLLIGQAAHILRLGDMETEQAIHVIEESTSQIMSILDMTQKELEQQAHETQNQYDIELVQ